MQKNKETFFRHKLEDALVEVERLKLELDMLLTLKHCSLKVALVRNKKQALYRALRKQEKYYSLYESEQIRNASNYEI